MAKYLIESYEGLKKVLKDLKFEQIYEHITGNVPNDEFKFGIWLSSSRILVIRSLRPNNVELEFCDKLPKDLSEYVCTTKLSEIKNNMIKEKI